MKTMSFRPLLYLTIGWFGIQMAMALDATQFQVLLDSRFEQAGIADFPIHLGPWTLTVGRATLIGLVLSLGPLAGITVQPFMGWLGDRLLARGIDRRFVMKQAVFYALVCTLLFTLNLNLWALIAAIAVFFISFNALNVNYRAMITQTSNRRALFPVKGTVSGFIALFSGMGSMVMFLLFGVLGNSIWPVAISAAVLLVCFVLVFRYSPGPKDHERLAVQDRSSEKEAQLRALAGPRYLAFYALPILSLLPAIENKLAQIPEQRAIFRLFLVVFFSWLGIQALRIYFILFATKELHLTYAQGNLILAVLTLVMVLAALPLGKMADRFNNRKLLLGCLVLFMLTCGFGWWMVTDLPSAMVLGVLMGMSFSGMIVLPLSLLFKLCPKQSEGVYSGLYNMFMSVPQLYSLFITGWLVDSFGSYRMILAVGAVTVACAALLTLRLQAESRQSPV
jgi:MFS family permease